MLKYDVTLNINNGLAAWSSASEMRPILRSSVNDDSHVPASIAGGTGLWMALWGYRHMGPVVDGSKAGHQLSPSRLAEYPVPASCTESI